MNEKNIYLIGLTYFEKFGPSAIKKALSYFPSDKEAYYANENNLIKAGIPQKSAKAFQEFRLNLDLDSIIQFLKKENIKTISIKDKSYPSLLKEITTPPPLLYYKGTLQEKEEYSISIVGSRKFTPYGEQATEFVASELSRQGITIISGLAIGIDSLAHSAALKQGGRTIAILGTGINEASIYPASNKKLAQKIIDSGGAIISEFPPFTEPLRFNFPQRNRIISGCSLGTLIVEAQEKSGTLITASLALEQNREVFAVPGNIFSLNSIGPNRLIQQGAKSVTSAKDITEELDLKNIKTYINNKKIIPETKEEELIIKNLNHEPLHVNSLAIQTNLNISQINATLIVLEIKGMVKNIGGMQYILTR